MRMVIFYYFSNLHKNKADFGKKILVWPLIREKLVRLPSYFTYQVFITVSKLGTFTMRSVCLVFLRFLNTKNVCTCIRKSLPLSIYFLYFRIQLHSHRSNNNKPKKWVEIWQNACVCITTFIIYCEYEF